EIFVHEPYNSGNIPLFKVVDQGTLYQLIFLIAGIGLRPAMKKMSSQIKHCKVYGFRIKGHLGCDVNFSNDKPRLSRLSFLVIFTYHRTTVNSGPFAIITYKRTDGIVNCDFAEGYLC